MSNETGNRQGKLLVLPFDWQEEATEQFVLEADGISCVFGVDGSSIRETQLPDAVAAHFAQ